MDWLAWALDKLNLLDFSRRLSVTNLAVYVIIVKIAISQFDWASASTLLIVLLNYGHKRYVNAVAQAASTPQTVASEAVRIKERLSEVGIK